MSDPYVPRDAHWYIPQEGQSAEGNPTERGATLAAARGYPQVVHYHTQGAVCNERCHRVDPPEAVAPICSCACHYEQGVKHFAACCWPPYDEVGRGRRWPSLL